MPDTSGAPAQAPARFPPEAVKDVVQALAQGAGLPAADAHILADSLVEADVRGASTHGVSRLSIYLQRIQKGLIDPRAELGVEQPRPGVLTVDAGSGVGQVQAVKVLERLFPMARELGVASATIKHSQHFGALSYYCNRAAAQDMLLIATTNAEPAMPPHGGMEAFFGTNPIGASIPTRLGFPIQIDMATSLVARGNVIAAARRGSSIPLGWAIDGEGNPTTDAEAALAGAVLPMAGHKGYALALLVEILSGVLSGAAIGSQVGSMYKHMDREQNVGHFFLLIDVAAFMDLESWYQRMDGLATMLKGGRRQPGVEEILLPGEPEHRAALRNRAQGIALDAKTLEELAALCVEYGVSPLHSGGIPT